jgi:hypothetical protein
MEVKGENQLHIRIKRCDEYLTMGIENYLSLSNLGSRTKYRAEESRPD